MVRKLIQAGVFAALGMFAMTLAYGTAATAGQKDKEKEKLPDIKEIMTKGHKGTDAYLTQIGTAAKDGKWEDAQKYAKTLVTFGEALGKNTPPKGEKESWEKLTKAYLDNTKAVMKGADDKDAKATQAALGAIGKSCGGCHKAHK